MKHLTCFEYFNYAPFKFLLWLSSLITLWEWLQGISIASAIRCFKGIDGRKNEALRDVCQMPKEKSYAQREVIPEVIKVILLIPATNASHERAASVVRPIKTFSMSTLSQQRLNHCMILHIITNLLIPCHFLNVPLTSFPSKTEKQGPRKFTLKYLPVHNNNKFNRRTQVNDVLSVKGHWVRTSF